MGRVDAKLAEFADELTGAAITLEDAAAELRRYRDSVDFDPAELAQTQERFSAFKGLLRQWGPRMEDVFARRDEAAELLSLVDDADARVRRAREARDAAEDALARAARDLTKRRNTTYLAGLDPHAREERRAQMLAATPGELRSLGADVTRIAAVSPTCVFGGREVIAKSNAGFNVIDLLG